MTAQRSTAHRASRAAAVAGETDIARTARLFALEVMRRVDIGAERLETWWKAQLPRTRVGLVVIALILGASFLNVVEMRIAQSSVAQPAAQPAAAQPVVAQVTLTSETAPADAGRVWSLVKMWTGGSVFETQRFTVGDHWRVDWVFNQTQPLGQMQVYIYSADGRLLNIATNVARSDANTSFWAGAGTYELRVQATGGDWKLDVQDLH